MPSYALFTNVGSGSAAPETFLYFWNKAEAQNMTLMTVLVEILEKRYGKDNPDSEEKIWLPIEPKITETLHLIDGINALRDWLHLHSP